MKCDPQLSGTEGGEAYKWTMPYLRIGATYRNDHIFLKLPLPNYTHTVTDCNLVSACCPVLGLSKSILSTDQGCGLVWVNRILIRRGKMEKQTESLGTANSIMNTQTAVYTGNAIKWIKRQIYWKDNLDSEACSEFGVHHVISNNITFLDWI